MLELWVYYSASSLTVKNHYLRALLIRCLCITSDCIQRNAADRRCAVYYNHMQMREWFVYISSREWMHPKSAAHHLSPADVMRTCGPLSALTIYPAAEGISYTLIMAAD